MQNVLPKISVITPSFNQAQFIEETILSVIGQHYPNLEYIIMDGGSTDNTVEIIKKYEDKITFWKSSKDNGQADAINTGFDRASGDIICWLNSDDFLMPGALHFVASKLNINAAEIIGGNCFHFKENSALAYGSNIEYASINFDIKDYDFYIQPSSFWTKKAWLQTGKLDEDFHFCFDWEWFIRAKEKGVTSTFTCKYLSAYRLHQYHKSGSGDNKRIQEMQKIYEKYKQFENLEILNYLIKKKNKINSVLLFCEKIGLQKVSHIFAKLLFPKLLKIRWRKTIQILSTLN